MSGQGAASVGKVTFVMRLPAKLKAYLAEKAKMNRRSLNEEIVYRLIAGASADGEDQPTREGRFD